MSTIADRMLAIVPDSIEDRASIGVSDSLGWYYNPCRIFGSVLVVHPRHKEIRRSGGVIAGRSTWRHGSGMIRRWRPDIVRAYGGYWPAEFAALSVPSDVPLVVSVHDYRSALLDPLIHCADVVWCVSKTVSKIVECYVDADRIRLHPDGVDVGVFNPGAQSCSYQDWSRRHPRSKLVLFVGRLSPEKNLRTVIGAMRYVAAESRLVIVGSGDNKPYRDYAAELGVLDRCDFYPRIANEDLPGWYAACDVFCVPSLGEGYGMAFTEAAACGAPIVTSDRGAMNERFVDGESALLLEDPLSEERLGGLIAALCRDCELARFIGENARVVSLQDDLQVYRKRQRSLYLEALSLVRSRKSYSRFGRIRSSVRYKRLLREVAHEVLPTGVKPWLRQVFRGHSSARPSNDPFL